MSRTRNFGLRARAATGFEGTGTTQSQTCKGPNEDSQCGREGSRGAPLVYFTHKESSSLAKWHIGS